MILRRFAVVCAVLLGAAPSLAWAKDKKALVLEPQKSAFKELARGLRVTLKQNHNYQTIKDADYLKEAKKRGLGTGGKVKGSELIALAKALDADLLVLATAKPGKGKSWEIAVNVDATDGRGRILSETYQSPAKKLDRSLASDIARAIRTADAAGGSATPPAGDKGKGGDDSMNFSLGEEDKGAAGKPGATGGGGMDLGDGQEEVAIKVAPKALRTGEAADASESDEKTLAQEYEDDEFYEPSDELTDKEEEPRYVAPDGRSGLVVTAGFAMMGRSTNAHGTNGTPPQYKGALSPGVAFNLSLFPRRFKEGGGVARDFGGFVSGYVAFMPSSYTALGQETLRFTDGYLSITGGAHYRHVFGNQEKSISIGARIGATYDRVTTTAGVPVPTIFYISPLVAAELEVPVYRKKAVLFGRAGVLPISGLSKPALDAFGLRKYAFGVGGAIGVRSTIYNDLLYLEAVGTVTNYWNAFSAAGTSRFTDVAYNDLIAGFSLSAGVAY